MQYVVPPLEGFWWQDDVDGVDYANGSAFYWISVIRLPDFVTKADFDWAVETATKKSKFDCSSAEYLTIRGRSVRSNNALSDHLMMSPQLLELLDAYLEQNGYANDMSGGKIAR